MSGHSKWATIHRKKGLIDAERGKIFQKLAKEIMVAARGTNGDIDSNASLRAVVEKARSNNMPKDNILKAIDKATGASSDINYGKSFDEAITNMKERIPSDTINNILLNIRESNMFGNSIIGTLNNQLDYLRETKILETKAYISKIPVKISVISVVFFVPLLLLLILGPVLIEFLG